MSSSQAGKSYEQLKEELGDAAAITRITAVSFLEKLFTGNQSQRETADAIDTAWLKPYRVLLSITPVV